MYEKNRRVCGELTAMLNGRLERALDERRTIPARWRKESSRFLTTLSPMQKIRQ